MFNLKSIFAVIVLGASGSPAFGAGVVDLLNRANSISSREGVLTEQVDANTEIGRCSIAVEGNLVTLNISGTSLSTYYQGRLSFELSESERVRQIREATTVRRLSSSRSGLCGDQAGARNIDEMFVVTRDSVSIVQSYSCVRSSHTTSLTCAIRGQRR